jgi:hypothetical protein
MESTNDESDMEEKIQKEKNNEIICWQKLYNIRFFFYIFNKAGL